MKFLFSSCIFLLLTTSVMLAQQQLAYNLKVGDQFSINQESLQTIKQEIEGMNIELINDIDGTYSLEIKEVTATSYIVEFEFTRFAYQMRSDMMGTILDVDTDREVDADDMSQKIFQGLLNIPMQFEMLKTGQIVNMKGGDALIENMITVSGITDPAQQAAMREGMEAEYGGQGIANSFEQFTYFYPATAQAVGSSWTNSIKGKLEADNTWTFKGIENGKNLIEGVSDINFNIDSGGTKIQAKGVQNTTISCTATHGFIITFHSESTATGTSYAEALGDTPIPTTITTITDYTIN